MTNEQPDPGLRGAVDLSSPILQALAKFREQVLGVQAHTVILIAVGPMGMIAQAINPKGTDDSVGKMEMAKMMLIQKAMQPGEPQPVAEPKQLTDGGGQDD